MARKRSFHIALSQRERKTIRHFQKKTASGNARTRCAILLAVDARKGHSEKTYREVASASGASETTVITTLREFLTFGGGGDFYWDTIFSAGHSFLVFRGPL